MRWMPVRGAEEVEDVVEGWVEAMVRVECAVLEDDTAVCALKGVDEEVDVEAERLYVRCRVEERACSAKVCQVSVNSINPMRNEMSGQSVTISSSSET